MLELDRDPVHLDRIPYFKSNILALVFRMSAFLSQKSIMALRCLCNQLGNRGCAKTTNFMTFAHAQPPHPD
jgi:hypothetical protein